MLPAAVILFGQGVYHFYWNMCQGNSHLTELIQCRPKVNQQSQDVILTQIYAFPKEKMVLKVPFICTREQIRKKKVLCQTQFPGPNYCYEMKIVNDLCFTLWFIVKPCANKTTCRRCTTVSLTFTYLSTLFKPSWFDLVLIIWRVSCYLWFS